VSLDKKILRALKVAAGTHTVEDMDEAIRAEKMQLWQDERSVVVTELVAFPQYNVINIALAAGDLDAVMAWQPKIEQFARENGASRMRMMGREGWSAVLPKYGWKPDRRVMFEKEL